MLKRLEFQAVGPAPKMQVSFSPRLNLITGDNGLGKSFLLDAAWWALTGTWARRPIVPHPLPAKPRIKFAYTQSQGGAEYTSKFDRSAQSWSVNAKRPAPSGLVVYAQADGSFALWDPARNDWSLKESPPHPPAYLFKPEELWSGNPHCAGLVRDWALWQRQGKEPFATLKRVLCALSPSPTAPLTPGELQLISLEDPKEYPTLRMSYGQDVPVVLASAGIRRILALSYLLVWAWSRHVKSVRSISGAKPSQQIVLLFDEIEAHLHPQWQRRIVHGLLKAAHALTGNDELELQLIGTTEAPLVLASLEPIFTATQDAWFRLGFEDNQVVLRNTPFISQGEIGNWLVSAFSLEQPRSLEGEQAILLAERLIQQGSASKAELKAADQALRQAGLPDIDTFWVPWRAFRDRLLSQDPALPEKA